MLNHWGKGQRSCQYFKSKRSTIAAAISLAIAFSPPALSANFTASTETELRNAILAANASADASSTITLSGNIALSSANAFPASAKPLTVNTNGFNLSGFDQPSGTISGGSVIFTGGPTIVNSGDIRGGNAFSSASTVSGVGGTGLHLTNGSMLNNGTITGGTGGDNPGASGGSGTGGVGAQLTGGSHINDGTITGGVGGLAVANGVRNGGSGVVMTNASLTNNGTIQGGDSVATGTSNAALSMGGTTSLTNHGTIRGGMAPTNTNPTRGGAISVSTGANATIVNTGTIEGGTGGAAIYASFPFGAPINLTVINSGTIRTGGPGAGAIYFDNDAAATAILELRAGSIIDGLVLADVAKTNDIFRLGGDISSSFDVSAIGLAAQYRGFNLFQKTGNSTWTLTGSTTQATPWVISAGALSVSSDANLGGAGGITLDGGALRTTSAFTSARNFTLNAGGGAFDTAADLTLTGVISGAGTLTKTGSGALILNNTNTYTGATNVIAGALAIGDAGNPGAALTGSNVTIGGGGTFGGYGSITGNVSNAGTLAVANAISSFASNGNGTFTINGDLVNSGNIQIGGPGVGNQLIVTGNYSGNNGLISLNSYLGADGSPSDLLVLDGGAASGTSRLLINNIGGPGLAIASDGIQVIRAQNGATSSSSAFSLGAPVKAGAYEYYLAKGGLTVGNEENWYLRNYLIENGVPVTPLFRREASIYSEIGSVSRELGLQQLGTFRERHGDQIIDEQDQLAPAWMRVWGSDTQLNPGGTLDPEFDGSMFGMQLGHDLYQSETDTGHRSHFGLMGGVARAIGDVNGFAAGQDNLHVGNLAVNQYSFGGYWTHIAPGGWYTDTTLTGSVLKIDGQSNDGGGDSTDGNAVIGSVETGLPIRVGQRVVLEPQVQLVWQRLWIDDIDDGYSTVGFEENNTYRARIGARLYSNMTINAMQWQPYIKANLLRYFGDRDETIFEGGTVMQTNVGQTSGQIAGGVIGKLNRFSSVYAGLSYQANLDSQDQRIVSGNVGVQLIW